MRNSNCVRVYQYIMPFQQMRPNVMQTALSSNLNACRAMTGISGCRSTTSRPGSSTGCAAMTRSAALDPDDVEELEVELWPRQGRLHPRHLSPEGQPVERLFHRPRGAEDHELHRHQAASTPRTSPCRKGWGRSSTARKEHLGTSDRAIVGHAQAPARGDARGRARREPARHRSRRPIAACARMTGWCPRAPIGARPLPMRSRRGGSAALALTVRAGGSAAPCRSRCGAAHPRIRWPAGICRARSAP